VQATLYVIPGSHPSMAARLMLERKGIAYKRRDLIPIASKGMLKAARFPGITVPALKLDGRRIQGSREIARELDRIQPDPPLLPTDPDKRARVEEAELWGDEVLQDRARRMAWWALRRNREPLASYSEGARLGIPTSLALKTSTPVVAAAARLNQATDENVRADLAALPADLERIDAWIADGVLGGDELNAADYQIAPSLRLIMTFEDLRPLIEDRAAGKLALRAVPDFPGHTPPILPAAWLEPLKS
jgi:glutathione S-transferase